MTLWKTLVVALVAAFALAACSSSSNNGDTTSTDDPPAMASDPAEQIAELQEQINELRAELGLDPIDIDDLTDSVDDLTQQVADLQGQINNAAAEEERKAAEAAAAAAAATAAKLYAGIAAEAGGNGSPADGSALSNATDRAAAYNDANVPSTVTPATTADTRIMVGIGTATPVALSEDKKTMVDPLRGWEGKRYTAEPDNDGMYEAMVYSNVGEPTEGDKFGQIGVTTGATGYEYGLDANGILVADGGGAFTFTAARIASPSFDQSAGIKEFELPTNNVAVMIPGSYHGVSGTYSCVPAADSACAAQVAASGFTLGGTANTGNAFTTGGGTWTFKPGNPEARVMSTPDAIYASYGWWIHKSEDGQTFIASAFVDDKGDVTDAAGLTALQGTATYMGGAAGKYALSSSTGGTNDAGHFTARATLEANFSDNTITGTIDDFHGADGMRRYWSVELKEAAIADTGGITRTEENDTVWTIDGTAADASGAWSGSLQDNGDDGVPKVATGTFDTTFGTDGKMVGAFGVNVQ